MYVGLDVSKSEIVCVGMDKEGTTLYEGKFGMSKDELDRLVGSVGADSIFTVEASTHGVFVYDYLAESKRVQISVANPARIRLIAESEKKTDREDASILADLLRSNRLPTCYVPIKKVRETRDLIRHRKSLVEIRTMIKNKVRAILAREGVRVLYKDILGMRALQKLNVTKLDNAVQQDALRRLVHVAEVLRGEISEYDMRIDEEYSASKYAQLLDTIPGVSHYSAVHIASAIGDISRFPTDEKLASYAGVVPIVRQSGKKRVDRGLKHGDKLLRWILVQDAHAAIRSSKRFRKYYLKKKRRHGHHGAIVATARKMVEIIHCMLTRGEKYRE